MSTLKTIYLQHLNGANTNAQLDANGNMTVTGTVAGASSMMFRNKIINGGMDVWQRGTSFAKGVARDYTADRWMTLDQPGTFAQSTDAPTGFAKSMRITTANTSYGTIDQRIESVNSVSLNGQTITISFYAKAVSGGAGGAVVTLAAPSATDNFTTTSTVGYATSTNISSGSTVLSSSWSRYSATIPNTNSDVAKGLEFYIYFPSGSSTNLDIYITGIQVEAGTVATPFERRDYSEELRMCQRYCYVGSLVTTGNCDSLGNPNVACQTPVPMRTTPTLVSYSGNWRGALLATITSLAITGYDGVRIAFNSTQSGTANALVSGGAGSVYYVLTSEL